MKKLSTLLLAIAFVLGVSAFTALADTVEISLRVGESTLNINGEPVEVEAPFIIDGTTLVPVRVITEAFGAEVDWNADTREVTLTYRNVEVVLQIDNINVYINNQPQTLLTEPRLTNGVTMVPLRFISENFGADVGWDESTQAVAVTKETVTGVPIADIQNVLQGDNMSMIGDSHLGWSLRRSPDMVLWYRQFDGRENIFSIGYDGMMDISHFNNRENLTLEMFKEIEMDVARGRTLVGQEVRHTASGVEFVVTQFRDRFNFTERRVFVRDGQVILIETVFMAEVDAATRNEHFATVDTFDFVFRAHDTEDLSDIVDGMRLFEHEEWAISLRVPADWFESSDFRRANHFMLATRYGTITMGPIIEVASVQSGDSPERWAREMLEQYRRLYSPQTHTLSELRTTQINGIDAHYFEVQINLSHYALSSRMLFWEYEEYMYNLYITVLRGNEALMQRIIDSVSFDAIDYNAVGAMMRMPIDISPIAFNSMYNVAMGFSIDVPVTWRRSHNNTYFSCERTGVIFTMSQLSEPRTIEGIREHLDYLVSEFDVTTVHQPSSILASELSSSALSGFVVEYRAVISDGTRVRHTIQYSINSGDHAFLVTVIVPEHADSPLFRDIIARMVRSFTVN